jgi:hypothetical protein
MKYVSLFKCVSKQVFRIGMLVLMFLSFSLQPLIAQDSIPPHSAHKASIYSLVLPGLGQAYNKKYWKIPVIYAGFGVLAYNINSNNVETKKFTEAYRYRINGDTFAIDNEYVTRYSNVNDLLRGRDFYRRRVELSIIFTAAWYLLNVVDAAVDAHFFDYDISEDLSLNIQPIIIRSPEKPLGTGGIQLSINFK